MIELELIAAYLEEIEKPEEKQENNDYIEMEDRRINEPEDNT